MDLMSHPQIQNLLQRYEHLEKRDRIALNGLLTFLGFVILYALIWSPANNFYEDSKQNHERQLSLLQYLQSTESRARASAGNSGGTGTGQPLLQTVSTLAGKSGIQPDRLQPEGSDGVSVWFDDVSFNSLMQWLEVLNQQGIIVRQVSIDREEQVGVVDARIILRN